MNKKRKFHAISYIKSLNQLWLDITLQDIFYSRKNFARPELQLKPHRSFEQEVVLLDEMFADGAAYCLGLFKIWVSGFEFKYDKRLTILGLGIYIL